MSNVQYDKWLEKMEKYNDSINYIDIDGKDILKFKESEVYFLSLPGRMGEENNSYIVIKENNKVIHYICDFYKNSDYLLQILPDEIIKELFTAVDCGFGNVVFVRNSIINEFNELVLKEKDESGFWQELAITFASWEYVADKILNK